MGKIYEAPGNAGSIVSLKSRYNNFIGGEWVAPEKGQYMPNISPVTGKLLRSCEINC